MAYVGVVVQARTRLFICRGRYVCLSRKHIGSKILTYISIKCMPKIAIETSLNEAMMIDRGRLTVTPAIFLWPYQQLGIRGGPFSGLGTDGTSKFNHQRDSVNSVDIHTFSSSAPILFLMSAMGNIGTARGPFGPRPAHYLTRLTHR